jgi:hypothetical protein
MFSTCPRRLAFAMAHADQMGGVPSRHRTRAVGPLLDALDHREHDQRGERQREVMGFESLHSSMLAELVTAQPSMASCHWKPVAGTLEADTETRVLIRMSLIASDCELFVSPTGGFCITARGLEGRGRARGRMVDVNRLGVATSPYLLQHAGNPVDWWEWGENAFEEARRRDVPILLSVGYSSCHWCHVMACTLRDRARGLPTLDLSVKRAISYRCATRLDAISGAFCITPRTAKPGDVTEVSDRSGVF